MNNNSSKVKGTLNKLTAIQSLYKTRGSEYRRLREDMKMDGGNFSRLIRSMEEKGLVLKCQSYTHPNDHFLYLTGTGILIAEAFRQ